MTKLPLAFFAAALALPVSAQAVLSSQASVGPELVFDLFEFHPQVSPPVTQNGGVALDTPLWPLTALPGQTLSGAPHIEMAHPGGSSLASFTWEMSGTPNGDELILHFDWLAHCHDEPPSPFGFFGSASAQGGCLVQIGSLPSSTCGVQITASLDGELAPDSGSVAVDVGDDSVLELQGSIQGPAMHAQLAAHERVSLSGGMLPIRVSGNAYAQTDGGHRTVTVHVEIRISPGYAASAVPFGAACSAGAWTPSLAPHGASLPQLGTTFVLDVGGLPVAEPRLVVGFVATDTIAWLGLPLPLDLGLLGMPGCTLHIAPLPEFAYPLIATDTAVAWPLAIPAAQSLLGFDFFAQALVEAAGANAFGAVTTNACHCVMGA